MQIDLKPACEDDIQFLLDLRVLTMGEYLEKDGILNTTEEILYRVKYNFEDAQLIQVGHKRVGLFKATYLEEKNQWYLVQIQIHPDFQNLNIGSYLVKNLIFKATQQNKSVGLGVLKSNPAFNLYKRLGFRIVEETNSEFELVLET